MTEGNPVLRATAPEGDLFPAVDAAVAAVAGDGRFVFWNAAAEAL